MRLRGWGNGGESRAGVLSRLSQVYMYQLFRSLAYIHSQGVCHRDIKPQNLLVDPDTAVLKLCDFGRWVGLTWCVLGG